MSEDPEIPPTDGINWKSVALRIAIANGTFHHLSTRERDAVESALYVQYRSTGYQPGDDPTTIAGKLPQVWTLRD
jgi:hypothetical protein